MKMPIFYRKKLFLILPFLISFSAFSQERLTKTIEKTFPVSGNSMLSIENKYGNVTVEGWEENSISITIDVEVSHKKRDEAKNLLNRINPKFNTTTSYVNIVTQIDKKSTGIFSRYFDKVNPFDFNKSNINVNYKVLIPKSTELDVSIKFGDLIIDNWQNAVKTTIEHGNIWINNDISNANISLKFGKMKANSIKQGLLKVRNSEVNFKEAELLTIESSGSRLEIESIGHLKIKSSKDNLYIDDLDTVEGDLKYSDLNLHTLAKKIKLNLKIAELKVSQIANPHPVIILNQESSRVDIAISNTEIKFDAKLEQGLLRIPKSFRNIKTTVLDKKDRIRSVNATYNAKENSGVLSIIGLKGMIILTE